MTFESRDSDRNGSFSAWSKTEETEKSVQFFGTNLFHNFLAMRLIFGMEHLIRINFGLKGDF